MKELSIEEKAKAYDEAIEKAKTLYENANGMILKKWVEQVFPELKESEDERIRKALIRFHKSTIGIDGIKGDDIVVWLEKQGDISPTEDELEALRIAAYEPIKNWSEKLQSLYEKLVYCEYKPADNIEPKFKVGDKVYALKNRIECTIESIDETTYYGDTTNFDIKDQNNWKLVEQKLAWSEEDEIMLRRCISATFDHGYLKECDWLKSLRPQNTWKPSDEQIEALNTCLIKGEISYVGQGSILQSLYDKLKTL